MKCWLCFLILTFVLFLPWEQIRKEVTSRTRGATSEEDTGIKTKATTELGNDDFLSVYLELFSFLNTNSNLSSDRSCCPLKKWLQLILNALQLHPNYETFQLHQLSLVLNPEDFLLHSKAVWSVGTCQLLFTSENNKEGKKMSWVFLFGKGKKWCLIFMNKIQHLKHGDLHLHYFYFSKNLTEK